MKAKKNAKNGVLILVPHLDLGGGARRIKSYCDFLDPDSFAPLVCVYTKKLIRDVEVVTGKQTPFLNSANFDTILAFAKRHNTKVVYMFYDGQYNDWLFGVLQLLKKNGIKIIGNNVFSYYDDRMDKLFDSVVFQTRIMYDKFLRNAPAAASHDSRYAILFNPVHTEYFSQFSLTESKRQSLRNSFGFTADDIVIGRFGRNDIVKWGDILTTIIFRSFFSRTIKFFLVGVPRSRRWLFSLCSFLDPNFRQKVVVVQPTADDRTLMEYMQMIDLVGHGVKIGEGCSNAINECMYWSKVVITNPTPHCDNGQVEQVDHEKTGIVARSSAEWLRWISVLQKDRAFAQKLEKAAHEKVLQQYEAKIVVSEFERIIATVEGKETASTPITQTAQSIQKYLDRYKKNALLTKSVRPTSIFAKLIDTVVRGIGYLEFRFFNG